MGWRRQRCHSLGLETLNSQPFLSRITHHVSRVQAITFDVGGTLIQPWPSVGHVYAAVAARHGLRDIPVDSLNRQFAAAWKNLTAFNYTRSDWSNIVNQTFLGLTRTPLADTLFSDLYREFERAESWRIFDDVLPTLEALGSQGIKLGIISNWDERLRPLLRDLNLDRYFHTIVVSCEGGACKPSPLIFQQAAQKLALPAADILHIGDNPVMDFDGASAARFQTLLLSRTESPGSPGSGQLASLLELPSLLHHDKRRR